MEVLLCRERERWLGRGVDDASAIADAVRQMFPSYAAQWALERLSLSDDDPTETEAEIASERSEVSEDDGAAPVARDKIDTTVVEAREEEPDETKAEPRPLVRPPATLNMDRAPADAVDEVDTILREVIDAEEDIAQMSPRLVQLHMLAWLCRARSVQGRYPRDDGVRMTVARVASTLGRFANAYWPGSIPALRLDAAPTATASALHASPPPRSWAEAGELAEQRIASIHADRNLDEDGWRDAQGLHPRPADPDQMLARVCAELEELLGSLDEKHDRDLERRLRDVGNPQLERLRKRAYRLRWLRLGVADGVTWGRLMGRLRWAAHRLDDDGLARAIDPDTYPPSPARDWASFMTAGAKKRARAKRRAELDESRPWRQGATAEPAAVFAWLVEAFAAFNTDELVSLVSVVREAVLALDDAEIASLKRGHRRRFAALRRKLADGELGAEIDREVEDEASAEDHPPVRARRPDPGEALIARVREAVAGKATLFVTNRDDPELQRAVERAFDIELEWCDGSPRRLKSAVERIEGGRYDLVIGTTGFMNHTAEDLLGPACKRAGVPYARAYRGRTLATGRAIATAMGIAS